MSTDELTITAARKILYTAEETIATIINELQKHHIEVTGVRIEAVETKVMGAIDSERLISRVRLEAHITSLSHETQVPPRCSRCKMTHKPDFDCRQMTFWVDNKEGKP